MKTFLVIALLCSPLAFAHAQQPSAAPDATPAFTYRSNPVVRQSGGTTQTYLVLATEPPSSKLVGQKIQLRIEGVNPGHTSTQTLVIYTGKFKTVGATEKIVTDIFWRFASGPVVAGQELGRIGNVNLGGEMRFVAASADQLDYKIVMPGKENDLGHFTRADVVTFLPLLADPDGKARSIE